MPKLTGRPGNQRAYVLIMGTCAALIILAWFVVRLFSVPAAIGMSAVAAVLPPVAAIVANNRQD